MKKILALTLSILCAHILYAQSIKTFEPLLSKYTRGSSPDFTDLQKIKEPLSLIYDAMYSINYNGSKTLYGKPIQIIALGINNDTITAIDIYVAFDSTLHKDIELDLGTPEFGWMGFAPGTDTSGIIWNRYWDLPAYSIGFKCTKYQYQMGRPKENLIAISILTKRLHLNNDQLSCY